ncbi:MAG TPA: hypothetical protein VKH82_10515 [Candidatus Binatia bacterium]|nr:hypothetical protein [Candidatus Binatia bacterium]
MTWSFRIRYAAVLVAMLARPAPCASGAVEAPALVSQLNPAWERLAKSNEKFLTKDQEALLHDLAFATAAAGGCPGFTIDREKFEQGFQGFKTDDYMKLPAEEKRKFDYHLMMNHGAATALYTAEGLLHPKDGCRFAEKKRSGGPGRFGVEPASAPPAR